MIEPGSATARPAPKLTSAATATALTCAVAAGTLVHLLLRLLPEDDPILVGYGLMAGAWLFAFSRELPRAGLIPLAASAAGFAMSAGIDRLVESDGDWRLITEDGAEFLGIWTWVVLSLVFAADSTRIGPGSARAPTP